MLVVIWYKFELSGGFAKPYIRTISTSLRSASLRSDVMLHSEWNGENIDPKSRI